jgi:Dihydrodipicolinate reductase, N-terminus
MTTGRYRVVVWATGGIGATAIRTISNRPDLDLVGVWVHSEEKVGKDAGELSNGDPIGVAATNDADALIALKPDCVIYAASGPERDAVAIPEFEVGEPRVVRSGRRRPWPTRALDPMPATRSRVCRAGGRFRPSRMIET